MKIKWTVGPLFVAGLCALYCANPMNLFWPFFWACALHELGHFIAIFSFGKTVEAVKLGALGAVIETQTLSISRGAGLLFGRTGCEPGVRCRAAKSGAGVCDLEFASGPV